MWSVSKAQMGTGFHVLKLTHIPMALLPLPSPVPLNPQPAGLSWELVSSPLLFFYTEPLGGLCIWASAPDKTLVWAVRLRKCSIGSERHQLWGISCTHLANINNKEEPLFLTYFYPQCLGIFMEREADGRARPVHLLDPSPHLIRERRKADLDRPEQASGLQSQLFMMLCPQGDRRQGDGQVLSYCHSPSYKVPALGRIKISEKPTCLFIINIS